MKRVLTIKRKKHTLKHKLFAYMFLLAVFLLLLFFIGMFLIGGYTDTKQQIADTLEFQTEVFERQITSYYNNLAVMGIQLSERTAGCIDRYLSENDLNFSDLNGSQTHVTGVQEALIDQLNRKLLETDCTGAFILLNTQINPNVENAETSRSGLYLQRNSLDSTDSRILLYRGLSDVGKNHDAMPHRKWRLEFDTEQFPNYEELVCVEPEALAKSYRLTEIITLPGTSERVMLLTLPIFGTNEQLYGLCGLEISESYFKHVFAQPSELSRATFCLSRGEYGLTGSESSFSAGIADGYYLAPNGQFRSKSFGSGLFSCESDEMSYIGMVRSVHLCPGEDMFSVSTLIPRQDYNNLVIKSLVRIVLLMVVIVAFSAICCLYFSKRYLRPLKQSIAQIRQKEYGNTESRVIEVDDLFAFLAEQDRKSEEAIASMQKEMDSMEEKLEQIRTERNQDKQELQRLAYSRKTEVDPNDYENFRRGIHDLTVTERRVFDYYLEGKSVKEITELMGIKESTVRFHNRNIYVTLGVNSLKQLLRCAAIMKQESENIDPDDETSV